MESYGKTCGLLKMRIDKNGTLHGMKCVVYLREAEFQAGMASKLPNAGILT